MLSISTLKSSSQASQYYQSENYYSKSNEDAHSKWLGKGAENLGLNGAINQQAFKNLLEGSNPYGDKLVKTTNGKAHRPGYDLTFSAPKSVSILGIVGDDARVIEAHRHAVRKVVSSIESEFAAYRAKTNGQINIQKTGNFIVAAFEHIDSRALDPNLHTHCVLMNLTQREDGAWRTIFGDELYNNKLLNGMQYRAFLAEELMNKGFNIVQTSNKGTFELENFDKGLLDQFSKRRRQITDKLQEAGFSSAKASSIANLETRSEKTEINFDNLKEIWTEELKECGSSIEWLKDYSQSSLERGPVLAPEPKMIAEKAVSAALGHLSERQAVFSLNQVISTAKGMTVLPCTEADLLKAVENKEHNSELLYINQGLFTTPKARELELNVISNMKQGLNQVQPIMSGIEATMNAFFMSKNVSHKEALNHMLTSSDRQIMVSAQSKHNLDKIISHFSQISKERRFYPVGLTQSAANVDKFKKNTSLERVNTIEGFLRACEIRSEKISHKSANDLKSFQARSVWIVDTQVNLKQVNELQKYSKQFGSRIMWTEGTGKSSQGLDVLIKGIISRKKIVDSKNINQNSLINYPELSSKIQKISDEKLGYGQKATDFYLDKKQDEVVILTTNYHQQVNINHQVRENLKQKGVLTDQSIKTEILHPLSLSTEQKRLTHSYQLGDVIKFSRNYSSQGIEKNSYLKVENIEIKDGFLELKDNLDKKIIIEPYQIDTRSIEVFRSEIREINKGDLIRWTTTQKDGSDKNLDRLNGQTAQIMEIKDGIATVKLASGKLSILNLGELTDKHWDHGHAMTLGKASSQRFDHALVIIDANSRLNADVVNNLNSAMKSVKNINILTNEPEILKENIKKINLDIPTATERKVAFYETKEAIKLQEKPITQSYFPKIESACLDQTNSKMNKISQSPKDCTEHQFRKVCEAIDNICFKYSEKEAVFNLEKVKQDVFSYAGLEVSREMIEFGFSKAFNEGWLAKVEQNHGANEALITTRNTYLIEKECLTLMKNGQEKFNPIIEKNSVSLIFIKEQERLTAGQKNAIELILTTEDRIVGVQGVAGSGKTTMLKEVKRLAEDSGFQTLGLSNTASAANRMAEASDIQTMTTAKFLNQFERQNLDKNQLIILDEASLTSNKEMHQLLNLTQKNEARLVLVGDVKQMSAIEAGKPFYLMLGSGLKSACMTENVRFKNPETLKVMQDLYAARISDAMDKLKNNIVELPNKEERLTQMANEYLSKSPGEREQTLIITPLNEDRQFVNDKIRQHLISTGELKGEQFISQNLIQKDIGQSEKRQIYSYNLGDVIRFNHQESYAKVIKQDFKSNTLTLVLDDKKEMIWSPVRDISSENAVSIYRQEQRELMAGDKLIWKLNNPKKHLFNGNLIEITEVKGSHIQAKSENRIFNLDLNNPKDQHWDYAYAVTLPVAQGRDVPYTLGHCESPKPYQKNIDELKIGDLITLPKREFGTEKNSQSRLVNVTKIEADKLTLKDRKGQLYTVDPSLTQNKTWDYYPPFEQRKSHELPKSTSLNGFLVEATRGDNIKLFVDNIDYFAKTLEAHQSIKESAIEYFHPNWQEVSSTVNAMTAQITGKAITSENTFKTVLSKPKIDKDLIIQHLNKDVLGYTTAWKGKPTKVTGREARWGKKGSFSVIIQGEKAGAWCNFESGEAGRDLIGLYMNIHGMSFKESLNQLSKENPVFSKGIKQNTLQSNKNSSIEQDCNDKKIAYARDIYRKTVSIHGTSAEQYLRNRGIEGELPRDFRYTPNAIHPDTKKPTSALIAPIKNQKNEITGVVRIFLNKDGTKLNKTLLGEDKQPLLAVQKANLGSMKNAAVKIQSNPFSHTLYVAEGIETALSIAKVKPNQNVFASLSVSQLKNIPIHSEIDKVVICADNDGNNPNSRKAIISAVDHHLKLGKRVFITIPQGHEKSDFNDLLKQGGLSKVIDTLNRKVEIHNIKQLESNEPRFDLVIKNIQENQQKSPFINLENSTKIAFFKVKESLER